MVWVYLYQKGHKILAVYPTLLAQLVDQGELDVNNNMDLILEVLYYLELTVFKECYRAVWISKFHLKITIEDRKPLSSWETMGFSLNL